MTLKETGTPIELHTQTIFLYQTASRLSFVGNWMS
jgi:hypothetical protein